MIRRILHKTSHHFDCFIFQMFKVQLLPIVPFKSETKSKLFTWILPKRERHDLSQ